MLIDYTYDFVAPDGKLTCGEPGMAIEGAICREVKRFLDSGEPLFVLNDIHYEGDADHPESRLFPPHNIAGSPGRELYGEVKTAVDEFEQKAPDRIKRMDKTRYSAFAMTELDALLRGAGVDTVQLMGVCTDICVLHTAIAAYNRGYDIVIPEDCVASFSPEGHAFAIDHFKGVLGAKVVQLSEDNS